MMSSPRTPAISISSVTRAAPAWGLGKPFWGSRGGAPPRAVPEGAPHSGDRSWLQLILMAILSPGRYPEVPSLWVSLKLRNSASHACFSLLLPARFRTSREVMVWTTFWLVCASSHQCPVAPSQLGALGWRSRGLRGARSQRHQWGRCHGALVG